MSRTARATTTAIFGYARFAIAIATGLWLVPFTIHHVGVRLYGFWMASGEFLGYAALTELGVLVTVPWLIAEADGAGDRERMRRVMITAVAAALISAAANGAAVSVLAFLLPRVVHLGPGEHLAVLVPVLILAISGIIGLPLRVFNCVLHGIQDVGFVGALDLISVLANVAVTAVLLQLGFGLYALAFGSAAPQLLLGLANVIRVGSVAPDLLRHWRLPSWREVRALFGEGTGAWMGGWGWRLHTATDSLVLATLGRPTAVTILACTTKLSGALVQLSWQPCDSGLVGLASLAGERNASRLRDAIVIMFRVYLALAGATACIVLAMNPAFVSRWVGGELFAGGRANVIVAVIVMAMTFSHALVVVSSVLGQRIRIGMVTFGAGLIHVAAAFTLGWPLGVVGVLLAQLLSHGVVVPILAWRPFRTATQLSGAMLWRDVVRPWAIRQAPVLALAIGIEQVIGVPSIPVTAAIGALISLGAMWYMRPLYLEFGPVRSLYDRVFARWTRARARA